MDRCPFAVLREPDPQCDVIVDLYLDWQQGVLTGWPERYAAVVVEGVHYLAGEIRTAEAAVHRHLAAEAERRHKRPGRTPGTVGRDGT